MEAAHAAFELIVQFEVDVVVEEQVVLGLVCDRKLHACLERHREIAVEGFAVLRACLDGQAGEISRLRVAHAEKIADRRLDAGVLLTVPPGAQHDFPQEQFTLTGERRPNVGDDACAFIFGDGHRPAGLDMKPVVVAASAVVGGEAARFGLAQFGQSAQRRKSGLGHRHLL